VSVQHHLGLRGANGGLFIYDETSLLAFCGLGSCGLKSYMGVLPLKKLRTDYLAVPPLAGLLLTRGSLGCYLTVSVTRVVNSTLHFQKGKNVTSSSELLGLCDVIDS
jgi:hypothetical protein